MCSHENLSALARRNALGFIENSVSHWLSRCSNLTRSANAATGLGRPMFTKSKAARAEGPSSTRTISLLFAVLATIGSPRTQPKRTVPAGSATHGNDPDQWLEVERLLNLGLWAQAEEAIHHLVKGQR